MKKIFIASVVLLGLFAFTSNSNITTNYSSVSESTLVTGEGLFQKNCSACHGLDKKGNPPTFPSLVDINQRLKQDSVAQLLVSGRNVMPSFSHLTDDEREAIVGYLYGNIIEVAEVTELSLAQMGESLFVANCTRCHKLNSTDATPPSQLDGCGMKPPVLGGVTNYISQNQFKNILNRGPWYMPSFTNLSSEEKQSIYSFLETKAQKTELSARQPSRSRCGCGR